MKTFKNILSLTLMLAMCGGLYAQSATTAGATKTKSVSANGKPVKLGEAKKVNADNSAAYKARYGVAPGTVRSLSGHKPVPVSHPNAPRKLSGNVNTEGRK